MLQHDDGVEQPRNTGRAPDEPDRKDAAPRATADPAGTDVPAQDTPARRTPFTPSRRSVLSGSVGAAAALAAPALLTGCASARGDGSTLEFWNFYAPQNSPDPAVKAQSKWFEEMVDAWNASHETKIKLVYMPLGAYNNGSKLPSAFAVGEGPDIFLVSPGDFLRYYNGDILVDLTPYLDKGVVEDYGTALDSRMVDGKVYALPMEIEPLAIFYDVAAFEKAGLSEGDIPTTWDQILDVGDKVRGTTRAGLAFETAPGYYQNFTWYPFMWQGGGEVLDGDGNVTFNSKATRQALAFWQDAVRHGITPRTTPAAGDVISAFKAGNVSMWQQGIWQVASFKAYAPKFEYGVFPLPTPPGGEHVTALGGWSFCANGRGRNPEAAAEFCAWALGSMREDCIDRMVRWCTGVKTDIAPRATALERGAALGGYDFWAMRKFKDEIAPGGRAEPRYPPVVYKAISDAIQGTMLADRGVESEADRAAQAIEAYTKSYQGASLI